MVFMKISNKVLCEIVFFHSSVCYNARCKNVEKKNKKQKKTFIHVALAKCKQQQKKNKKNKKK